MLGGFQAPGCTYFLEENDEMKYFTIILLVFPCLVFLLPRSHHRHSRKRNRGGSALLPRTGPAFMQTLTTFKLTLEKKKYFTRHILSCVTSSKGFTHLVAQCKAANTQNTQVACPHNLPATTSFNKCKNHKEGDTDTRLILRTHKNKCIDLTLHFCF